MSERSKCDHAIAQIPYRNNWSGKKGYNKYMCLVCGTQFSSSSIAQWLWNLHVGVDDVLKTMAVKEKAL